MAAVRVIAPQGTYRIGTALPTLYSRVQRHGGGDYSSGVSGSPGDPGCCPFPQVFPFCSHGRCRNTSTSG